MNSQELQNQLAQFYGSETIYKIPYLSKFFYTEGIKHMATVAEPCRYLGGGIEYS